MSAESAGILRPGTLPGLLRAQEPLKTGSVLDRLCLSADGTRSLGGIPKGCAAALIGPPGKGKTRTALAALARAAASGLEVGLVVAEEVFRSPANAGRDDLCSRLVKIAMAVTGSSESEVRERVLSRVHVLEAQHHRGQSWDELVARYRFLVERARVGLVVIDALHMLDPGRDRLGNHLAAHLSALKTYSHEHGVTLLGIGQVRESGVPIGGEELVHIMDAAFVLEELSLGSKEMAEQWGGKYRDKIDVLRAAKSVTTPTFPHPVRVCQEEGTGALVVHPNHPEEFALPHSG